MAVSTFSQQQKPTEVKAGAASVNAASAAAQELPSSLAQTVQDVASEVSHKAQDLAANVANKAQETASAAVGFLPKPTVGWTLSAARSAKSLPGTE